MRLDGPNVFSQKFRAEPVGTACKLLEAGALQMCPRQTCEALPAPLPDSLASHVSLAAHERELARDGGILR